MSNCNIGSVFPLFHNIVLFFVDIPLSFPLLINSPLSSHRCNLVKCSYLFHSFIPPYDCLLLFLFLLFVLSFTSREMDIEIHNSLIITNILKTIFIFFNNNSSYFTLRKVQNPPYHHHHHHYQHLHCLTKPIPFLYELACKKGTFQ